MCILNTVLCAFFRFMRNRVIGTITAIVYKIVNINGITDI